MSKLNNVLRLGFLGLLFVCLQGSVAPPAAHAQGFGERLGEQLDEGINRLSSELRQGWESLRNTVDKMGVQGRVYSRLRWDKELTDSRIEVDVREGGVVLLRGQVSSAAAQRKANRLASDTVGVNEVVDELDVAPPESPRRETAAD